MVGNPAAKVREGSGVGVARRRKPRIHAKRERGIFGRFSGAVFGVVSRGRKGLFSASKTRGSGWVCEGCQRGSDGGAILRAEGRRGKKVFRLCRTCGIEYGTGRGGFGHFPRAHLSGTGKGRARSEGENFFRVSPSARYLEAIFGSARGSPSGNVMAARDERIPPTNIKTCLFLSWGWSNICAECRSSRAVSLCGSRVGSLPSGRLREGMPSPWRVEAETGRRRPESDSTGSEDVRRTEKAKEGLKVWRARESHGT